MITTAASPSIGVEVQGVSDSGFTSRARRRRPWSYSLVSGSWSSGGQTSPMQTWSYSVECSAMWWSLPSAGTLSSLRSPRSPSTPVGASWRGLPSDPQYGCGSGIDPSRCDSEAEGCMGSSTCAGASTGVGASGRQALTADRGDGRAGCGDESGRRARASR